MARTYFFMGWNRDRDHEPDYVIAPIEYPPALESRLFIDRGHLLDAMRYLTISWDMGAPVTVRLMSHSGAVFLRGRKIGYAMACVKEDDSVMTWDWQAMQTGPRGNRP